MKIPGPDHPIAITPNPKHIQVLYQGHIIADTTAALVLTEANYPRVLYFPRADVEMAALARTAHQTHCPYKGDASYYSIVRDGVVVENAIWTYETPYEAVEAIRDHLAFYPNKVEFVELDQPAPIDIDQVILHTDSGSGRSQGEPWPPTVETPA